MDSYFFHPVVGFIHAFVYDILFFAELNTRSPRDDRHLEAEFQEDAKF